MTEYDLPECLERQREDFLDEEESRREVVEVNGVEHLCEIEDEKVLIYGEIDGDYLVEVDESRKDYVRNQVAIDNGLTPGPDSMQSEKASFDQLDSPEELNRGKAYRSVK